jgi:type II secretory pathway pseudopilin PulG
MIMPASIVARIRRAGDDERGITLVELVVAMMILSLVSIIFTSTLTSIQRAAVKEDNRSQLDNQARLALQTIDRQVRSGNLLYPPASESDPYTGTAGAGYMIRIYTQTDANTSDSHCALWLIDNNQQLKYRYWPANQPEEATEWRVIATGIVNRTKGSAAFTLDATGRTASVNFYVNVDYTHDPSATQLVSASLTGRNTSFGYPADVCEQLPSPVL